jgi:ATP-dependent helicase YprA (DUF1998 family)
MVNYNNGKIYKIVCNNSGLTYYGSTTRPLCQRIGKHKHKTSSYTSKKIIDGGNYNIILVENFPCNNKEELCKRERFYIENNECVNKAIPGRTLEEYYQDNKQKIDEYQKKYRLDNREKILELKKKNYQENKEKISEYNKKHYQENKEKLSEKITCSCGSIFTRAGKSQHERTKKHKKFIQEQV